MKLRHRRARAGSRPFSRSRDEGATMVEFALVLPVLMMLVFGAIEFGFHWRVTQEAVGASRSGARVAAGLGRHYTTDYETLTSIRSSLGAAAMDDQLQRVIIYRANSAGNPPAGCFNATPSGACNVYSGSVVRSLTVGEFSNTTGCSGRALLSNYCPNVRVVDQRTADYIGVYVIVQSESLTGFVGQRDVPRKSVMRMEPTANANVS